jgi:hypothetical protein
MTFQINGNPMPFDNRKYSTREEAETRLNELKLIYDLPMSVREIKGGK